MWTSVDSSVRLPLTSFVGSNKDISCYDYCLTGASLSYLLSFDRRFFNLILPQVKVFARVAPKQKVRICDSFTPVMHCGHFQELVITSLKELGFTTLMCGDGTNDVGKIVN